MTIIRWIIAEDKYQIINIEAIKVNNKNIIFVGIIEERQSTVDFIKKLLTTFDYEMNYANSKGNIVILNNDRINLVAISMSPDEVEELDRFGLEFDFLIINIMDSVFHKDSLLKHQFRDCHYYIINTDGDNLNLLSLESLDGIVITYGFNSKATMTISSHNIDLIMEASLCLQREIITLSGDRVSPFEFVLEIDSKNKDDIYSVLATSILSLVLDDKIQIKNNLKI